MMKSINQSFLYPPINKGKIEDIYPWNNPFIDHISFLIPKNKQFLSKKIGKQTGTEKVLLFDSGRSALTVAIQSILSADRSEVLMPAFCCQSIVDAVLSAGGTPVFIDITDQIGVDLNSAEQGITDRTAALVVTNTYGLVDHLDKIGKFCLKHHIYFINDLAQIPMNYDPRINKCGDLSIFSFGPEKHVFSLGGGALTINNPTLTERVEVLLPKQSVDYEKLVQSLINRYLYYLRFKRHLLFPTRFPFASAHTSHDIDSAEKIVPKLMHPVQMYDLAKKFEYSMRKFDKINDNFQYLCSLIRNQNICRPYSAYQAVQLYFTIRVPKEKRYALTEWLDNHKIASVWNYVPLYYYDAYRKFRVVDKKITDIIWREVVSIPFRNNTSTSKLQQIAEVVNSFFSL